MPSATGTAMDGRPTYREQIRRFRTLVIEVALFEHGGNRSRAARALGLQRTYLLRLIRELNVQTPGPPRPPGCPAAPTHSPTK